MIKTAIYNLSGQKSGTIQLPEEIFSLKSNPDLIHQAVVIQLANARSPIAHTKTRGEVSGSGRKLWRQKGTGRARVGDIRPPHWIGGGVAFGPRKDRRFARKFPKKMRRKAIFIALADKLAQKRIIVLNKLALSKIKTKEAEKLLQKLPLTEGTILLLIGKSDPAVELSFQNLPYLKILRADCLNVYDILKYDWLILDKEALEKIKKVYLGKVSVTKKQAIKILNPKSKTSEESEDSRSPSDLNKSK